MIMGQTFPFNCTLLYFMLVIFTAQPTIVSINPLIKFQEELLTVAETKHLLSSHPPMSSSPHSDIYTGGPDLQTDVKVHRTSNAAGFVVSMEDLDHELRGVINKLAGLSGLPPSHGETLQIQNYGIGGQYTCHFDPSWNQEEDRPHNVEELRDPGSVWMSRGASGYGGRRIVTVVSYLADTCVGGDTVFPLVGAEDFELVGIQEVRAGRREKRSDDRISIQYSNKARIVLHRV